MNAHIDRKPGKPRVLILGGGFAGAYAALELEKRLGTRDDFEIFLVSKENYFVFHPILPEVISGTIGLTDVVSPLRRMLKKTEVRVRGIESIDLERKVVRLVPGFTPHAHEVTYDHLVIGLGTVTDFRGLRGLPEHALPFKDLKDALNLRHHVIRALEEASIEAEDKELRRQLLTFVVTGGGFSGVEVAAELNDFVRLVARTFRNIDPAEIRVVLVHSTDCILPELPESLGRFAEGILRKRGVLVLLNTIVEAATGTEAILADGHRLPTRTLVSTVPSSSHPLIDAITTLPKERGRIVVNGQLAVPDMPGIWALGDCAIVRNPDGSVNPPTAQHATRQAAALAHNLVASIRGGPTRTYDFKGLGKMGALGHRSAVAEMLFGIKLSGILAWFAWRTIYLMKMPGWGRRVKIAAAWAFDLILPPDLVQLRFEAPPLLRPEHFEPGQLVFHQGDLGDRVYMIRRGKAEVVQETNGVEKSLAFLGPGECFGEIAVLGQKTRGATVKCIEALDTVALPSGDFAALSENIPDLRQGFERVAEARKEAESKATP
ncbi:MAG: FAD-dependent oxidoreductase [Vicinamibacteria bacterium]|nr:FAD-dependent oxidoreductase [Vicinamibacteria bacterium]